MCDTSVWQRTKNLSACFLYLLVMQSVLLVTYQKCTTFLIEWPCRWLNISLLATLVGLVGGGWGGVRKSMIYEKINKIWRLNSGRSVHLLPFIFFWSKYSCQIMQCLVCLMVCFIPQHISLVSESCRRRSCDILIPPSPPHPFAISWACTKLNWIIVL